MKIHKQIFLKFQVQLTFSTYLSPKNYLKSYFLKCTSVDIGNQKSLVIRQKGESQDRGNNKAEHAKFSKK